jgi:hypothetical protein
VTVTFRIHNPTTSDRWVVTQGWFCDAWGLELGNSASPVPLHLGFQCLCECPNPGEPYVMQLHRVGPGATYDHPVTWDARTLVTCTEPWDCSAHGWPGMGVQQQLVSGGGAAPPAPYRIGVLVEPSVPAHCTASADDATCGPPAPTTGVVPPAVQSACTASATAFGAFTLTLPPGDPVVPLPLVVDVTLQ